MKRVAEWVWCATALACVFLGAVLVLRFWTAAKPGAYLSPDAAVEYVRELVARDPWAQAAGLTGTSQGDEFLERLTLTCLRAVAEHPKYDWLGCAREAAARAPGRLQAEGNPEPWERAYWRLRRSQGLREAVLEAWGEEGGPDGR